MTFYLRQSWIDERFAYDEIDKSVTLNYNDLNRIWIPDLFFRNEKRGMLHDMTVPNRLLRLDPDGRILYSQRYVEVRFLKVCSHRASAALTLVLTLEMNTFVSFASLTRSISISVNTSIKIQFGSGRSESVNAGTNGLTLRVSTG